MSDIDPKLVEVTQADQDAANALGLMHSLSQAARAFARHRLASLCKDGWVLVPREPTAAMLDAFVARALQVSVHGQGGWSAYGRNQWLTMIDAFERTPAVPVREQQS